MLSVGEDWRQNSHARSTRSAFLPYRNVLHIVTFSFRRKANWKDLIRVVQWLHLNKEETLEGSKVPQKRYTICDDNVTTITNKRRRKTYQQTEQVKTYFMVQKWYDLFVEPRIFCQRNQGFQESVGVRKIRTITHRLFFFMRATIKD